MPSAEQSVQCLNCSFLGEPCVSQKSWTQPNDAGAALSCQRCKDANAECSIVGPSTVADRYSHAKLAEIRAKRDALNELQKAVDEKGKNKDIEYEDTQLALFTRMTEALERMV